MTEENPRFVALDLHKNYFVAGAVDAQQNIVLQPRRVTMSSLEKWASKQLRPSDEVVIEVSTNTWTIYDRLSPLVSRVVVAHPFYVKLIAASVVKTDKRDTLTLAKQLAAKMIPEVWVPPMPVRELRALIAHRQRLMSQQTAAKNRLQAVVYRNKLVSPKDGLFTEQSRTWWDELELPASEKLRIQHNLDTIAHLSVQIAETERELALLSASEQWFNEAALLIQLPGIGMIGAMTILSAVGDITRFPSAKQLVGYAGLGGKVHASGKTHRGGGITKQGRPELRYTMVEAAWTAVRYYPFWQTRYEKLARRIGEMKAITAIARKLLVIVWHVLTNQEADRHADLARTERKLLNWATRHRLAASTGMSRAEFVNQAMQCLGVTPVSKLTAMSAPVLELAG